MGHAVNWCTCCSHTIRHCQFGLAQNNRNESAVHWCLTLISQKCLDHPWPIGPFPLPLANPYESPNQPVPEVTTTQDGARNPPVVFNESTILTRQKLAMFLSQCKYPVFVSHMNCLIYAVDFHKLLSLLVALHQTIWSRPLP